MTAPKKMPARGSNHDDEPSMPESGTISTPLGLGWRVEVTPAPRQANVVVRHPSGRAEIEVEIVLTADGPRLRARASTLEVETEGAVTTRCESFRVEARDAIELVANGGARLEGREVDVVGGAGDVRVLANDDVKLKGEMVLLNCDREEPTPTWVDGPSVPTPSLAVEPVSGSTELARLFAAAEALEGK